MTQKTFFKTLITAGLTCMVFATSEARAQEPNYDACKGYQDIDQMVICVNNVMLAAPDAFVGHSEKQVVDLIKGYVGNGVVAGILEAAKASGKIAKGLDVARVALSNPLNVANVHQRVAIRLQRGLAPSYLDLKKSMLLFFVKEMTLVALEKWLGGSDTYQYIWASYGVDQAFALVASSPPYNLGGPPLFNLLIQEGLITADRLYQAYETYSAYISAQDQNRLSIIANYARTAAWLADTTVKEWQSDGTAAQARYIRTANNHRASLTYIANELFPAVGLEDFSSIASKLASARRGRDKYINGINKTETARNSQRNLILTAQDDAKKLGKEYVFAVTMLRDALFTSADLYSLLIFTSDRLEYCPTCSGGYAH